VQIHAINCGRKKEGAQASALKKIAIAAIREVPGLSD
jgi:hypothetical protein